MENFGCTGSTGEFEFDWRISIFKIRLENLTFDWRILNILFAGSRSPHRGFRVENLHMGVLTGEFEFDWRKCDI